jgi:hypothetical protein
MQGKTKILQREKRAVLLETWLHAPVTLINNQHLRT